jgi:hypothetical protein
MVSHLLKCEFPFTKLIFGVNGNYHKMPQNFFSMQPDKEGYSSVYMIAIIVGYMNLPKSIIEGTGSRRQHFSSPQK